MDERVSLLRKITDKAFFQVAFLIKLAAKFSQPEPLAVANVNVNNVFTDLKPRRRRLHF